MLLEASDLHKSYDSRSAVAGVSLSAGEGEIVGLLGPNGAGKTTTVAMLCGLLTPDRGEVRVGGHAIEGDDSRVKCRIGLVPQDLALYEDRPALSNLQLFGALYGIGGALLEERCRDALALVGLSDRAKDKPQTFSGGMKRRLNIACALIHDPDLLLLDEPTVGVDPQSRNAIFDNLEALKRRGKALVYTTHYMEEAERLCDRIVIVDHGKVVAGGTLEQLYATLPAVQSLDIDIDGTVDLQRLGRESGVGKRSPGRGKTFHRRRRPGARRTAAVVARRARHRGARRRVRACHARKRFPRPDRAPTPGLTPMNALIALLRNDLVLYFSNRRALIMSIAAPIAIAAFFGALFDSSSSKKPARIPIAVVDDDHSEISTRIIAGMKSDAALDVQEVPAAQAARWCVLESCVRC